MAGAAEPRLHGSADGEADPLQGGETAQGLGSSPGRREEVARVSSGAWSLSSTSSSSSLASDVESDDDGDGEYPWTQCEYEEIPSFRWIASPLRWWKPKKGSDGLSRKNTAHTRTTTRDRKEPAGGSRASETSSRLVHFEGYGTFTLHELLSADMEVLGTNPYWPMFKATLGDGSQVAVRRLEAKKTAKDFVTKVNLLGKIRHPNLLPPRAYYYRPNSNGDKFLVFDYMPKGSLSDFLHARGNSTPMDWPTRMNIAIGIARGLHHLHTQGNMVHGYLSSVHVLLDNHVNAKVGDYGLLKLLNPAAANDHFRYSTFAPSYHAPELSSVNMMSTKTDVYSLGVIMLELLTGKSPRGLDKIQWAMSIRKVETTAQPEFRDTLKLALKCVDTWPYERPEMQKVLQQLEEIKSKFEKTTHSTTINGGNKPNDAGAAAASTITTASPATGERTTSPFKDDDIQTPWTFDNFAHDGNLLQPCGSETLISSPLASSPETMPDPINSCNHKDENLPELTPQGDLNDPEVARVSSGARSLSSTSSSSSLDPEVEPDDDGDGEYLWMQCEYEEITRDLDIMARGYRSVGAIRRDKAAQRALGTRLKQRHLNLLRAPPPSQSRKQVIGHPGIAGNSEDDRRFSPTSKPEEISTESATPMSGRIGDPVTVSPTLEGYCSARRGGRRTLESPNQADDSAETERTDGTDHMPSRSGTGINPALSRIDWSKLENVQVDQLQVPPSTSPVLLISSEPDLIYQSYFLTLHKLANTSPPLPSDALEGQLNRMLAGLHSMGYPLDVWTKAASLLLVSAKKREHIERYVDDYKVRLDVQVGEFTSAVNLVKEDVSRIQSDLSALEQRNQELDETIGGLKLEQEKVVGELTVARDQLASAEAKAESMSMDMDRAKQHRSATSQLRDEMLQELPSVDQVFDSAFQEIMAKKF